jgi:hypothetical protein
MALARTARSLSALRVTPALVRLLRIELRAAVDSMFLIFSYAVDRAVSLLHDISSICATTAHVDGCQKE